MKVTLKITKRTILDSIFVLGMVCFLASIIMMLLVMAAPSLMQYMEETSEVFAILMGAGFLMLLAPFAE